MATDCSSYRDDYAYSLSAYPHPSRRRDGNRRASVCGSAVPPLPQHGPGGDGVGVLGSQ
jgi:hypothetical protein